ncbi:MAG: ABC transporter permease [Alphaproteobacteria bacterium]
MALQQQKTISPFLSFFKSREFILLILLFFVFVVGKATSPWFLDVYNLFDTTAIFSEISLVALSMALVIIARDIDISVASIIALSSLCMGLAHKLLGFSTIELIGVGITVGALCGMFNGFLIVKFKLPAIIVTIGTMSLFRGISAGILGSDKIANYPTSFMNISQVYFKDVIPYAFIVFLVFVVIFIIVTHYTVFGRYVFAIGNNPEAARFSGINPDKIRFILFTLNGIMAGIASVFLTSRLGSTRPDIALGLELEIITIVVLGGVSILGGKGTITGVFLAALVIGFLRLAITLNNIPGSVLIVFTGTLLILSVSLPVILGRLLQKRKQIS